MSYTESDVIENIYKPIINNKSPMYYVMTELIRWYEKQKSLAEVNDWKTDDLKEKIKKLRNML